MRFAACSQLSMILEPVRTAAMGTDSTFVLASTSDVAPAEAPLADWDPSAHLSSADGAPATQYIKLYIND